MIGVGVITHGDLANGIKNAAQMIMGEIDHFDALSLTEGADLSVFSESVLSLAESVNGGEGVLLFVDLFGATPFNTIASIRNQLSEKGIAVQIITGVNLPMIIEALAMRQSISLKELAPSIVNTGKESIKAIELPAND